MLAMWMWSNAQYEAACVCVCIHLRVRENFVFPICEAATVPHADLF